MKIAPHFEEVKVLALLPFSTRARNKVKFPRENHVKKMFPCPNPAHCIKTPLDSL